MLLCSDDHDDDLIKVVAEVCRARSIEWTICITRPWEGLVGPTFGPSCLPCFECYTARQIDPASPPPNVGSKRIRELHATLHGNGAMAFGHSAIGGLAALEIIRGIIDTGTARGGRLHIVDFWNMTITPHRFLPQPWCDVCLTHSH